MKTVKAVILSLVVSIFGIAESRAITAERVLTVAMSGFLEDTNSAGDSVAVPFRLATIDLLDEISLATGTNFLDGVILLVDDLDDTNGFSRIIVRTPSREFDITEFMPIEFGDDVRTTRFVNNVFKSAVFYAVDDFTFDTLIRSGIKITFRGLTKESQNATTKTIGGVRRSVVSATTNSDGVGELRVQAGFVGPLKGKIRISAPKFYP